MTTLYQPGPDYTGSQEHHTDAVTFLDVMRVAGAAMAKAARSPDPAYWREAAALYDVARDEAQLHAQLSTAAAARSHAAAVRELTTELDNLRRQLP